MPQMSPTWWMMIMMISNMMLMMSMVKIYFTKNTSMKVKKTIINKKMNWW